MADVSDEELARLLEQHEDRPWYAWADIVTNGEVVMMVTELQARRAAEARNGVGGTVAGCRERLCHSFDPHCQWPACHTASAALGARND